MLLLRVTSIDEVINLTAFLPLKVLYNPKAFFTHAWLHQACAHCAIFPTAPRRSPDCLGSVWLVILDQLGIVA